MRLKSVLVYAAIIVGTLLVAEAGARVWDWRPGLRFGAAEDGLGMRRYYHSFTGAGDLMPNQDGHWNVWFRRPYNVQTNSDGLRNVAEVDAKAVRILALGDSQTFGPYLANEDTWPSWTEYYLRQARRADDVQVFNAGISGYTITDTLAYMREKGARFKPAIVILAAFENDLFDLRKERNGLVQRPAAAPSSRIAETLIPIVRSTALGALSLEIRTRMALRNESYNARVADVGASAPSVAEAEKAELAARYGVLFRELAQVTRGAGAELRMMLIPSVASLDGAQGSDLLPVLRALAEETDTPLLDLTPIMRADPEAAVRYFLVQRTTDGRGWIGNGHLSREGNAVIGRAAADWMAGAVMARQ